MDSILQASALPNLHPAVVHFPIALLPIALLFDLGGLLAKRRWLTRSASLLWMLAAAGSAAATWAGERAVDSLVNLEPRDHVSIGLHSDWAHWTLWTVLGLAVLRVGIALRDRSDGVGLVAPRWMLVLVGLVAIGLVMRTADLGGALVYQHGIAVEANVKEASTPETGVAAPAPSDPAEQEQNTSDPPLSRLVEGTDGVLTWTPLPTDGRALGSVLLPAAGGTLEAVRASPRTTAGTEEGLGLELNGETMLLLPGRFGDVQVDAVLDLSAFEGRVGLVHHARSTTTAGLFAISADGIARLVAIDEGTSSVLDEKNAALPSSAVELAVSSSGKHLKGLVDGKTVVHGHVAPGEDGGCGLLFDGVGTIVIFSLRVTPLS